MPEKKDREKIMNVVLCALTDNGKILMIKRNKDPYKGLWGLLGGKIEFGEHVEDTAVREFYEETGIKAEFVNVAGIASEILYEKGEKISHFLIFVAKLSSAETRFTESDEGQLKWFELDKLDKEMMIPSDYLMVQEYVIKSNPLKIHKVRMVKQEKGYDVGYDVEEFI